MLPKLCTKCQYLNINSTIANRKRNKTTSSRLHTSLESDVPVRCSGFIVVYRSTQKTRLGNIYNLGK